MTVTPRTAPQRPALPVPATSHLPSPPARATTPERA